MTSITASTKYSVKKKAPAPVATTKTGKKATTPAKRGTAPPLQPLVTLNVEQCPEDETARKEVIQDLYRQLIGAPAVHNLAAPRAASTTRDRSTAAANLATAAHAWGLRFCLHDCAVWPNMQFTLFPDGIQALLKSEEGEEGKEADGLAKDVGNTNGNSSSNTLKPSTSALSLTSLDNSMNALSMGGHDATTVTSRGTNDTKRGKHVPAEAREGCLLLLRALCEVVGRPAEPYVVGAPLAAALDETGSANSSVREAAEDASKAILQLAHPWAFARLICPLLLQSLHTNEWRVKAHALECLQTCATTTAPAQVQRLIPTLIPAVTNQVWDTKAQVSKAARAALLAICQTNTNPDVKKAIPAVVNAICKPADTNKAVSELMGTTFVVPVDAPTLAILCPVLARALKEKLAIHKRAACLVISNMSKLVETPSAVAPFGSLLVPELQKVSENVQFVEIRDEALKALANLTKALGDSYKVGHDQGHADEMATETKRVEAEQERLRAEKEALEKQEEERRQKEELEKKAFKEAMDAQRELDRLAAAEAEEKRKAEELAREKAKLSTKGSTGKCQACGLKKCKKTCVFYAGK